LVDGIVMAYLPGQEGGRTVSDVIFGTINPSGKLPYTYPKFSGNILPYYYKKADIRDIDWGYNGFYPQFEFGFGLSYTTFQYSDLKISKDKLSGSDEFKVSVTIKNTGKREGKEIVQVFIKDLVATVSPDAKKLVGFNKINLKAGATKTVEFNLTTKVLESIGINNNWIIEEGEFEILVGGNPQELLKQKVYFK
jgi:beta-glucosidase